MKHIDLYKTPISRRGSWMNLAYVSEKGQRGAGLYLRSSRSRPHISRNLFKISLPGMPVEDYIFQSEPGYVHLTDKRGRYIEIFFETKASLRICGNTTFTLESAFSSSNQRENASHAAAFIEGENRFVVNAKSWLRKYGLEILCGKGELTAPWDGEMATKADFKISPDKSGKVDIALDEFWSTWIPLDHQERTEALANLKTEWKEFVNAFSSKDKTLSETSEASAALIWMCIQSPSGILKREAIFMSLNWMDSLWSWDNWVNMVGIAAAHPELAMDQFRAIADHQDEFGAYPDAVNDGFLHFNFTKPPVQAVMIKLIQDLVPLFWTLPRITEIYPSLASFTQWWLKYRRSEEYGLCYYLHGNDSGWDNGTLLRSGVPLISPDLNAFLVAQCRLMAEWSRILNLPDREILFWNREGDSIRDALISRLWKDNQFIGILLPKGKIVQSMSLMAVMPSIISEELPENIKKGLQTRFMECEALYGLASESPESVFYEEKNYWRGPIWAPSTLIGIKGLQKLGCHKAAERVAEKFLGLVEKSGFAENFQAETGEPLIDPGYTWTAAVFLALSQDIKAQK